MYNWGYLKNAILAKLDLDDVENDEPDQLKYKNRFVIYANEAMTIICSTVKPNRKYHQFEIHNGKYDVDGNLLEPSNVNTLISFPTDFISFGDDVNTIDEDIGYGDRMIRQVTDEDLVYKGHNKVQCFSSGIYSVSYNARWFTFNDETDDEEELDTPADVLECIPSYVASQCMKVDDEYKSSVLRNEFEMMLARIDDTDYKSNKTFTIGGDW